MLDTEKFVELLITEGYTHLCVVPCSFAKNLINCSINNDDKLEYMPCASEAVACSVAAGLRMSGKKPIVVVQSSGLTNMGSCMTSLLKPYKVQFPIIVSWRTYKEGDSEIQHAHLSTELPRLIEAYGYGHEIMSSWNEVDAVSQINSCESDFKVCVLKKNTFSKVDLEPGNLLDLSKYPHRSEYLKILNELYSGSDTVFIGTTGNTAREMYTLMPDTKTFYMAGNMGGAASVALGAAIGGNDVIVCGGDAEFVMHMGALTTAGRYKSKLIYLLFDNESNKSTGGQNTYQLHVDYLTIAKASGWKVVDKTITRVKDFVEVVKPAANYLQQNLLLHIKASYDNEMPRPAASEIINSKGVFLIEG